MEPEPSQAHVALYDFDPSAIDWPFEQQQPLALQVGNVIEVIYDPGADWALGHLRGTPEVKGYFPKNYTVPLEEYYADMRRFQETNPEGFSDTQSQSQYSGSARGVPPSETMLITVPDHVVPGDELAITAPNGQEITVTVPEGTEPGEELEIPLPATDGSVVSGSPRYDPPSARPQSDVEDVGSSASRTMLISVPDDVYPGEELTVTAPSGKEITIVVPEGVGPGQDLEISLPVEDQAPASGRGDPPPAGTQAFPRIGDSHSASGGTPGGTQRGTPIGADRTPGGTQRGTPTGADTGSRPPVTTSPHAPEEEEEEEFFDVPVPGHSGTGGLPPVTTSPPAREEEEFIDIPVPGRSGARGVEEPASPYGASLGGYPEISADSRGGGASSYQLTKPARLPPAEEDEAPDLAAARAEVEQELRARQASFEDVGVGGDSQSSTPATQVNIGKERTAVKRNLPMKLQQQYLQRVSLLQDVVPTNVVLPWGHKHMYNEDLRARATTIRMAQGIEPAHLRMAIERSARCGARWTQMFRPGFNDIVNESFKLGTHACMFSRSYLTNKQDREQLLRMHIKDSNGILWFELQRQKDSIYYQRIDYVDVQMCHPDAWGFPDAGKIVTPNPGEPVDPFHGWCTRRQMDGDKEMEDVDFLYTLRLRCFPESTFQALALGKIPQWIQQYIDIHTDPLKDAGELDEEDEEPEDPEEVEEVEVKEKTTTARDYLLESGMKDDGDIYVKPEDLNKQKSNAGPDVLDVQIKQYNLKGLSAMRVFLRSRGNPDNMKQSHITPKMVKDMAAQLGLFKKDPARYWYCLFALRYPLAADWEVIVKCDTRYYVHLPSDRMQIVHPMIRRFREHLEDTIQNEFLWEYRGFVQMKCSECGNPQSIIWCQQCTDYFCASCFLNSHKSARGKKHWPMPIPGCRYLTASEAARLHDHLPLLNVGFSMRRRFLARDNQSDRNGSRSGDTWLFFHADTFESALLQAPEEHWFLKRLRPPRLAPTAEGYYYNFQNDVIADDPSHIMSKAHEQKAIGLLQKNIRGALTRKRIQQEIQAARIIQKSKRMWDVRKAKGENGRNQELLKGWFMKFRAQDRKNRLLYSVQRVQAVWAGYKVRCDHYETMRNITRFQAKWKGTLTRRRHAVLVAAGTCIQRNYRGRLYGRRPMKDMMKAAMKIQALARGVALRERNRFWDRSATYIAGHFRGYYVRKVAAIKLRSAVMIQRNWRRFQNQLDVKIILYERMETQRQRHTALIRSKLEGAAAVLIQRNWRRYADHHRVVVMRRDKAEADKRISTLLTAFYAAVAEIRHYIHPWWRHLPPEIQEVLSQIKASMQRTMGLVHITGKLANEEIGKRGLRVSGCNLLSHKGEEPDLASHMLLSVTRHLLHHVPAELFEPTVNWACYAVGHQACALASAKGAFPREIIPVGKENPPHPGDTLATLWDTTGTVRHHHDWLMTSPDESLPCLILNGLPANHRHVFLTAQVLVTMRQALDSPSISTEDHLRFQGLDTTARNQLMEVLSSELDNRLPTEWPNKPGTVATLAVALSGYMKDLGPAKKSEEAAKPAAGAPAGKASAKSKAKGKEAKAKAKKKTLDAKALGSVPDTPKSGLSGDDHGGTTSPTAISSLPPLPEGGVLSHFNRNATMRVLQQVGYYMRDQDEVMQSVLAKEKGSTFGGTMSPKGGSMRANRFVSVTDKLFEMADRATHDHCSFVLAVVLFHMVLRGLQLRLLYHRAAIAIQQRYRYVKLRGQKQNAIAPTVCIQRFWRGLRAALKIMRWDDAAWKIQRNFKAWKWNLRSAQLLAAVLKIQRVWHSAVHRKWIKGCHAAATCVQRHARGYAVRLMLDKAGRELARKWQREMEEVVARRSQMPEGRWWAMTSILAAKARVEMARHRQRNLELWKLAAGIGSRSDQAGILDKQRRLRFAGALQPARPTVFEPMIFALARLDAPIEPRYGAKRSPVMAQVITARKQLLRSLPPAAASVPHAAAKRGRAAVFARRLVRKARHSKAQEKLQSEAMEDVMPEDFGQLDDHEFSHWMSHQFAVKQLV